MLVFLCVSVCALHTQKNTCTCMTVAKTFRRNVFSDLLFLKKVRNKPETFPFFQLCLITSYYLDICKGEIVFSQKILHIYFCIFTNASIMLLVSGVYLRKQRGQRMCESDEFLLRQLLFVNSTWTAPCTIHIFHPQEDVNQCQGQNIANLFSRNSNLQHAIHDVMNVCEFGFFSGEFCHCRSTL